MFLGCLSLLIWCLVFNADVFDGFDRPWDEITIKKTPFGTMTKQIQAGRKLESSWFLLGVTSTVLKQIGGKLMKTAGGLPFLGLFIFFRGRFEEI